MRIFATMALLLLVACTHTGSETNPEKSEKQVAKEHFKEAWQNIKEGSRDVATGVEVTAKKAGKAILSVACPVAGNIRTQKYFAKDSPGYEDMLSQERSDERECFMSEVAARESGYRLVQ
ncbi:MAG: hypothetical protein NTX25_15710 [Proteobacteria bacterium]|nr:hypothetical protein [Pseudomonadota bacterium]